MKRHSTSAARPEVAAEVGNRIPVFLDGGVRRGTDVFKALALGAKAARVCRPFLWGLGAFGQPRVDRVLEIVQGELKLVMGIAARVRSLTSTAPTSPRPPGKSSSSTRRESSITRLTNLIA